MTAHDGTYLDAIFNGRESLMDDDPIQADRRHALAEEWRERAASLDRFARTLRHSHYLNDAEDAEQAALDYRVAADDLEMVAA